VDSSSSTSGNGGDPEALSRTAQVPRWSLFASTAMLLQGRLTPHGVVANTG